MKKTYLLRQGFSLIELLVVIGLFALIGIVTTQAVLTSLKGSRTVDSEANIRQNLDYAMNIIERNLRSAQSVTPCPLTSPSSIAYTDSTGTNQTIYLVTNGNDGYIAVSGNDTRLTSTQARVTELNIVCTPGSGTTPTQVAITITATDPNPSDDAATITSTNKVVLRTNK